MISIVITAFNEPGIKKAIDAVLEQESKEKYELIISAPDKETENIVKSYNDKRVKYFKDKGRGKANAINEIFKIVKGEILILSDGDVFLDKNAVSEILKLFEDKNVGCVSGRPVALNSKKHMIGYWSNLLLDAGAHRIRKEMDRKGRFLECSGYLFAFRDLIKKIPTDVAEDSIIPYLIWKKGYRIRYAENARVFVKYPDNLKDFIKQRKRAGAGSHSRLTKYDKNFPKVKSFWNEARKGIFWAFGYAENLKELIWSFCLIFVRAWIWIGYYLDAARGKGYVDKWERVESTKAI